MVHPAPRVAACLLGLAAALATVAPAASAEVVPGEVVVRFAEGQRARALDRADVEVDAVRSAPHLPGVAVVELEKGQTITDAVAEFEDTPGVVWAEPNGILKRLATPNDDFFGSQYALPKISEPQAWDLAATPFSAPTDARGALTAIVDDGMDIGHADLNDNAWTNPGETGGGKESNGVDDDGNGFADDWRGWNFVANDNVIRLVTPAAPDIEFDDHGTHVSGIAGAEGNNDLGVSGPTWRSSLVVMDIFDGDDGGEDSQAGGAFAYAGKLGARVANASIGRDANNPTETGGPMRTGIRASPNTLFVVAAGNGGADGFGDNNDLVHQFPCNVPEPNVICVASSTNTPTDDPSSFSNFGATTVDLAAPGSSILSTVPSFSPGATNSEGSTFKLMSGTSMATPLVTGVAAQMFARNPWLSVAQAKDALLSSVDPVSWPGKPTVTNGRINARAALLASDDNTPPNGFSMSGPGDGTQSTQRRSPVTWTASGDAKSGIDTYEVLVDGQVATSTGGTSAEIDIPDGNHAVQVRALDRARNGTLSNASTVTVDSTAPNAAALASPASGAAVPTGRPRLSWLAATDATSGVAAYEVAIDGGAPTRVNALDFTPPATLRDGSHTWTVRAIDGLGNSSPVTTGSFVVDTAAPAAPTGLGPRGTRRTKPVLRWTAARDTGSGIVGYAVSVGGSDPVTATGTSLTFPDELEVGDYDWTVRAYDRAGNASSVARGSLRIDRTRPTLRPTAGSAGAGRVRVRCRANETVRCAISVLAPTSLAKRLDLGSTTTTLGKTTTKAARDRAVVLRLNARARRALRRSGRVTAQVRITATDLAGNRRLRTLRVRIR